MIGDPKDDPDRTPEAPVAIGDDAIPESERVTTVPPPPSFDPAESLNDTARLRAYRVPDEARDDVSHDDETARPPQVTARPVAITVQPLDTASSRPTARPAEAAAADAKAIPPDDDPLSEGWTAPPPEPE